jgi:hypothetical protein
MWPEIVEEGQKYGKVATISLYFLINRNWVQKVNKCST